MLIGRSQEYAKLELECSSTRAAFISVYGRRRVGKTFLIRSFFKNRGTVFCVVTGQHKGKKQRQLDIFQKAVEDTFFSGSRLQTFQNWEDAFSQLLVGIRLIQSQDPTREVALFLDELPWLATPKSGLLEALDHSWNTELQYIPHFRLIVCGSAASWIINNIVNAKGGLHNQITSQIRL